MKRLLLLLTVLACCYGSSMAQNCAANFRYTNSPTSLAVSFQDSSYVTSGSHESWYWIFGDNSTSTDQNPTHTYLNAGTYRVCLYIFDTLNGITCSSSHCDSILVTLPVNCGGTSAFRDSVTPGTNGLTHTFIGSAQPTNTNGGLSYYWSFGDNSGSTSASHQIISHTYTTAGIYNVCVTVRDSAGPNSICYLQHCDSIRVQGASVTCGVGYQYTTGPNIGQVNFFSSTSNHNVTYAWDFADGSAAGTGANPVHTYGNTGVYRACVTITAHDSLGNTTCTATFCDSVHVTNCGGTASFTDSVAPGGNSLSLNFTGTANPTNSPAGLLYFFNFGDGSSSPFSTSRSASHTYTAAGTYYVCLYVRDTTPTSYCYITHCDSVHVSASSTNCGGTASFTDSLSPALANYTVSFFGSASTTNTGGGLKWFWSFGDGASTTTSVQNPSHTYAHTGTYYVCLNVRDSASPNVYCYITHCDSIHVTVPTTNCGGTASFNHFPSSNAGPLTIVYQGSATTTNTPGGLRWYWNFGNGSSGSGQDTVHTYSQAGTYYVCLYVRDSASPTSYCYLTQCDSVHVSGPGTTTNCTASFTTLLTPNALYLNFTAVTTGPGLFTYLWEWGDGTSTGTGSQYSNVTHGYSRGGAYNVCLYVYAHDSLGNITCSAHHCDSVHVTSLPPNCGITFTDSIALTVTEAWVFFHTTITGTGHTPSYTWNWGDGSVAYTTTNSAPIHLYNHAGDYLACVTVTLHDSSGNTICTAYNCDSVHVPNAIGNCGLTVTDSITPVSGTTAGTIYFFSHVTGVNQNVTYNWYFGPNGVNSQVANPHFSYTAAGTYVLCGEAISHDSSGHVTCQVHMCDTVVITTPPPTCYVVFRDSITPGSTGLSLNFTATSYGNLPTYKWYWGDGTYSGPSSAYGHITHTYATAGTYSVCVYMYAHDTAGNVICTASHCDSIRVAPISTNCSVAFQQTISTANNLQINFYSYATGTNVTVTWGFGDGTSGTGANASHIYAHAGTYYVCAYAVAHDSLGNTTCTAHRCDSVRVGSNTGNNCSVSFTDTIAASSATGGTVYFHSTATGTNLTYSWSFGDGSSGTGANPDHNYAAGNYRVCVYATSHDSAGNVLCSAYSCDSVHVRANSTGNCSVTFSHFLSTANSSQVYFTATATGTSISYTWSFGDGTSATGTNASTYHIYSQAGTYRACVTIESHNSAGVVICRAYYCDSVIVAGSTCTVTYTDSILSNSNTVSVTATGTGHNLSFYWVWGDGTTSGPSSQYAHLTHTYAHTGAYRVCVYAYAHDSLGNGTCTADRCDSIHISPISVACQAAYSYTHSGASALTIAFTSTSTGVNAHTAYSWTFGDSTSGTGASVSHTYLNGGTYLVCLTITDYDSLQNIICTSHSCNYISLSPPAPCHASFTSYPSTATGNTTYFSNTSTGSTNTSNTLYTWNFGDSTTSNLTSPSHTFAAPGTYHVCLTITTTSANGSVGCTDDTCVLVTVVGPHRAICSSAWQFYATTANSQTLHFYASAADSVHTYTWNFGDGTTGSGPSASHTYANSGYYTVCLTVERDSAGIVLCTETKCTTINVARASGYCNAQWHYIVAAHTANTLYFVNTSTGGNTGLYYVWTFGDGDTSHQVNPNHTYAHTGTYTVCLTITEIGASSVITCSSQYCDSVVVGPNGNPGGPYTIEGNVYNGTTGLSTNAMVYLITLDTFNLIAVDSVLAPQGHYVFHNVNNGDYLVKAALTPNSPGYIQFLPTYYGDVLFWLHATELIVNQNFAGVDIHLQPGVNPGGPGFVGGNVLQGANKTRGTGDGLANYQVMVLTMDNDPVQYAYTDASGDFTFSDLAYGTYKIYTEVLSKYTIPAIVTIGPATEQNFAQIEVDIDSVVAYVTTGIANPEAYISSGNLYPNPVMNTATVKFNATQDGSVYITLVNILGQEMITRKETVITGTNQFQLDMSGMTPGFFILNMRDSNNKGLIFKIIKE